MRPVCLLVSSLAVLGPVSVGSAMTGGEIIARLNAERQAAGLPGDLIENPAWSEGCALHNTYQRINGSGHVEKEGLAGYTVAGSEAGRSAVLSHGGSFEHANPFSVGAPFHLLQILAPALRTTGAAENDGEVCVSTLRGRDRVFPVRAVFTVPPDGGEIALSEQILTEKPHVPAEFAGRAPGTVTGPSIFAYAVGPLTEGMRVTGASLVATGGDQVTVRSMDHLSDVIGPYMPVGSALILPVKPLSPATDYTASVTFAVPGGGVPLKRTWRVRTAPLGRPTSGVVAGEVGERRTSGVVTPALVTRIAPAPTMPGWPPVAHAGMRRRTVAIRLRLPKALVGQRIRVTYRGRCKNGRQTLRRIAQRPVMQIVVARRCATRRGTILVSRRQEVRLPNGRAYAPFSVVVGRR